MNKINKEIRDNYELYKTLLEDYKEIINSKILLKTRSNNPYWLSGVSEVKHSNIDEIITITVERSKRENKYGVKLRCKTLADEPFIRFDSDGPAHRNNDPEIPFKEQVVTTPHFNGFNQYGRSIAFKSEILKLAQESLAIVNDINFGVAHFCSHTNITLENGGFPEIVDECPELELEKEHESFKGVIFE
jgi:hypothetical protein